MQPSSHAHPDDPSPTPGAFRIEAEQSITRQVSLHLLRGPDGAVLSIHRRLGHAFDALYERGQDECVLESEGWEVFVHLDADGSRTRALGGPSNG